MEMEKTLETSHGIFLIRPYCDEDEEKVIELWETAFNQKMDRRIWRWKFQDNPFGRQIMLCLTEDNIPIAMYAGIPFPANWNGIDIRMTQLIDNMSHPDYRQATNGRKGLFIQTAEHFFDVYGGEHASVYHYGFPGKKHFRLGNLFLHYSMISDGGAFLEIEPQKLKSSSFPILGKVDKVDEASVAFDQFWESVKPHYPFSVKRDRKFIQWRFFEHPIHDYTIYAITNQKAKMLAWVTISVKEGTATLVDILALPGQKATRKLLLVIANKLNDAGVLKLQLWLPKYHFITKYLLSLGFNLVDEPLGIVPTGRSLYKMLSIDFAKENNYYTMADADLF